MRHFLTNLLYLLAAVVVLSGCSSARNRIVYIQGADEVGTFQNENPYAMTIRPDDRLSIIVNCKESELAAPFNMMLSNKAFVANSTSNISVSGGSPQTFWVDEKGEIEYPTIGKLKVEGLTRYELRDYLQNYLSSNGYIQDPIVNVDFYNAKYSVLGDVARPGQFTMTSDRVSLLDAIAAAGDLTIFGERDKVRFIREENGKTNVVTLDLKDPNIIKSPYFYLRQNDVIYVEPNKAKASNREVSSLYTFGVSFVSLMIGVTNLIINLSK